MDRWSDHRDGNQEMLRGVREAGEVLIVGYSLTAEDGSPMAASSSYSARFRDGEPL